MPLLPSISSREVLRAFQNAGFKIKRQKGSHIHLVKKNVMSPFRFMIRLNEGH